MTMIATAPLDRHQLALWKGRRSHTAAQPHLARREAEWAMLMRAANAGDKAAYERLLRTLAPVLVNLARRIVAYAPATVDAEDVVQETLLAIHLKRHTWKPSEPFGPWLTTILRHKAVDALRRHGRHVHLPVEAFENVLASEPPESDLRRRDIERHLPLISERQRQIVQAMVLNGASVQETAIRHDMSEGAVRVAWHRARTTLAKLVQRGMALAAAGQAADPTPCLSLSPAADSNASVQRR
jgi:RNA polymerase sigma-70 factor, ECF subfamily